MVDAMEPSASPGAQRAARVDDSRVDLFGVSVDWLSTGVVKEIRAAALDETTACIHDLENLGWTITGDRTTTVIFNEMSCRWSTWISI